MIGPMAESPPEAVERVRNASLSELAALPVEDVYVEMDWLLRRRPDPLDLYRLSERHHWSAHEVDFGADALHWAGLDGPLAGVRTELERTLAAFFVGEHAVTDTLAPLVTAAPDDDSRLFLASQLADEARHTVFFSRFFHEVVGSSDGIAGAVEARRAQMSASFADVFDLELRASTDAVRRDPSDYGAWVEAIAVYHVMVEGMLALTGQRFVLGILREMGILPGFYAGFTAVARDESRHVNFGVGALRRAGERDPRLRDRVAAAVDRLLEPACRVVAGPERPFAIDIELLPPNLRINPYSVAGFSLESLSKRLRAAGLSRDACRDLEDRGMAFYLRAWDDYEDLHGLDHPRRYFDRLGMGSS